MLSLLANPEFQKRALPLSVEAWHGLIDKGLAPKRAELLRGVIVEKMPKSILHIKLAGRLWTLLSALLGDAFWVRKEDPLTFADSEPEPDVSVVHGREADYMAHPTTAALVIEVSVSTLAEDREMASIYAEAGVKEYWIVNAASKCIEACRRCDNGAYQAVQVYSLGEIALCENLPGVSVDLTQLFDGLPPAGALE